MCVNVSHIKMNEHGAVQKCAMSAGSVVVGLGPGLDGLNIAPGEALR